MMAGEGLILAGVLIGGGYAAYRTMSGEDEDEKMKPIDAGQGRGLGAIRGGLSIPKQAPVQIDFSNPFGGDERSGKDTSMPIDSSGESDKTDMATGNISQQSNTPTDTADTTSRTTATTPNLGDPASTSSLTPAVNRQIAQLPTKKEEKAKDGSSPSDVPQSPVFKSSKKDEEMK